MADRIEMTEGLEGIVGGSFTTITDTTNGGYVTKGNYSGRKFHIPSADKNEAFKILLMNYADSSETEPQIIEACLKAGIFDKEF